MYTSRGKGITQKIFMILMVAVIYSGLEASEGVIYKLKIKVASANIRAEPSLTAKIISQAVHGAEIESDQKQGDWFRVHLSPRVGTAAAQGYLHQSVVEVLEEIEEKIPEVKQEEKPVAQKQEEAVEKNVVEEEGAWILPGRQKNQQSRREAGDRPGARKKRSPIALKGGVVIGAGLASLGGEKSEWETETGDAPILGWQVGAYLSFKVNKYLEIRPELSYVKKGGKQKKAWYGFDYIYHSNYIEMPILARFSYNAENKVSPFVVLGPFAAFRIGGKMVATNGEEEDEHKLFFRRFDYGLALGGGVNVKINEKTNFNVGIRYSMGLRSNNDGVHYFGVKARSLSILLGFSLM